MLWLCLTLPQLPLEALQASHEQAPMVITACEGSSRWIVCANEAAERVHLKPPTNYTVALAVCPGLKMLERNLQAENSALERLAAWAYQFSSTVVLGKLSARFNEARNAVLWLEIGASLKLFGGFRTLIETIEGELQQLGYTYRLGIGPTLEGAALLARAGIRIATTTTQALRSRIQELSIALLALPIAIHQHLTTSGVRTIGLLLGLPRDAISKRFGPEITDFLDRLVGDAADPRPAFCLPPRYAAKFGFDFELKQSEALLFPLKRMLCEFAGFLRGHDVGVQQFSLIFEHRETASSCVEIGLSVPDRNLEKFLALVKEKLERTQLPAHTIGLQLIADQFSDPAIQQPDFFSSTLQTSEELTHTIDRLTARLGSTGVYGLKNVADHRPECSWSTATADEKRRTLDFPERPLWLLPQPKPLQLSAMPQIAAGPERIESGWWDGGDMRRDYYVVRMSNGAELWVYRDLADNGQWYLHGFWA
jgi:protein ImuB